MAERKAKKRSAGKCNYKGHPGKMSIDQVIEKRCGEKRCKYFEESVYMRQIRLKNNDGKPLLKEV